MGSKTTVKKQDFKVNDRWIFIFVYPVFAFLTVHIGNDNTLAALLRIPSYYSDLLLAITGSYLMGIYWHKLFYRIDKKFDWELRLKERFIYQFLFALIIPVSIVIVIEIIYLFFLGISIPESSVFYLELPVVFMFSLIINLIYLILYYRSYATGLRETLSKPPDQGYREYFLIQQGSHALNVPLADVAYFIIINKAAFLTTKSGKSYLYDYPFKQIIGQLSPIHFFQLNRQVIAGRSSISKVQQTSTRRLNIELTPPAGTNVFVSKTRVSEFMQWLDHK